MVRGCICWWILSPTGSEEVSPSAFVLVTSQPGPLYKDLDAHFRKNVTLFEVCGYQHLVNIAPTSWT